MSSNPQQVTPLELEILLFHYRTAEPRHPDFAKGPAWNSAYVRLQEAQVLEAYSPGGFRLTRMGAFYVDAILSVPFPQLKYEIKYPSQEDEA